MNPNTPLKLIMWYCVLALVVFGTIVVKLAQGVDKKCWLPEGCKVPTQPVYQDNPYTYKAGNIVSGALVDDGNAIAVRIQPTSTYTLFTEDILLCSSIATLDLFLNKRNPVVLTYETKAHKTVQGVGCHDLKRVDELRRDQ